jgi:succinoglycan biosynthesis protein ExoA
MRGLSPGQTAPFVSVLLPVRNETVELAECTASIREQTYPAELTEIIVADASDKPLDPVHLQAGPRSVLVLRNDRIVIAPGLNMAAEHSRGDYLAIVSAHSVLPPDYIERMVDAIGRTGAANVGGRYLKVGRSAWGKAIAAASSSPLAVGDAPQHFATRSGRIDSAFPGFISRRVFERVGGFNTDLGGNEDDEFNARLRASGELVWYEASVEVLYRPRETLRALWRQYHGYARWKVAIARTGVPEYLRPHHCVPALALLLAAATPVLMWISVYLAAPTLILGAAYVIVSFAEARKLGRRHGTNNLRTWLVFPVLHAAYATGFVRGAFEPRLPKRRHGLPPMETGGGSRLPT